jgi:hypothetical protein
VLGRYVPQLAFLHILLGDEPVLSPEAHLYQRLLAMDQQESRAVVDQFLTDHTLTELYDLVLVPALIMAEQDRHKGALDDTRERFIFLTVNEMVAELFDFQAGNPENSAETYGKLTAPPPPPPAGQRVLCVPANDEADEIVAGMLAQLLEREGCVALSFPLGSSATDMLALMEPSADDVICISALPPFAVTHARNMCSQVRSHFPNAKILVGVWGFPGDVEKAMVRFRQDKPNEFVASLTSAIAWVRDPSAPVPRQRPTENVTNGLVSQQS